MEGSSCYSLHITSIATVRGFVVCIGGGRSVEMGKVKGSRGEVPVRCGPSWGQSPQKLKQ